jgi:hypothetical protein
MVQGFGGAYAEETKVHPWTVELYRTQNALEMTLDLLPLCAHDHWDAHKIAKVAEALAQFRFESWKASNALDLKAPNYQAFEQAMKRRDDLLKATLTDDQLSDLSKLKKLSEIIEAQGREARDAWALYIGAKGIGMLGKGREWEITIDDLGDVLSALKSDSKLANANIQSAIGTLQDVLKRHSQKGTALAKQLTSTLKKADVGL